MERKDWIVPTGGGEKAATARLSILVATGLAALKTVTFLLTGSVGVLASAADSLMDVFASGVNYIAIRVADEPEDAHHRYGHGKAEGMAGLFQSLVIGASAVYLVVRSVQRLIDTEPIRAPFVGIAVMAVSMVASILLVVRIRKVARRTESLALQADSLHYLSDVLATAGVLAALAAFKLLGVVWLDPVVSLAICFFILKATWQVFHDSWDNLMDRQLPEEEQKRIVELLKGVEGLTGFHDLRTRRSGARRFVDLHVEMDRELSFVQTHRIAEAAIRAIEEGLANTRVTIHADPWPPDPDAYREPMHKVRREAEDGADQSAGGSGGGGSG
ncbi:MAG: cation diffusion facilitator family transporter [Planctomycetota bacterium]